MSGRRLGGLLRTTLDFYMSLAGLRRLPYSIFWMITWECNSRCLHCEWGKSAHELRPEDMLEFETVARVVSEAAGWGARHIAFAGGEAFLRRDFLDIISHCKKEGFAVTVSTNGFLLSDPAFAGRVVGTGVDRLDISLDAPDELHDRLRGVPGAFEKVDRALTNLVALKKSRSFYVGINTVVNGYNFRRLDELFAYAARKGIDGVGLQPFHEIQARRKDIVREFNVGPSELGELRGILESVIKEYGWLVSNSSFFIRHIPAYYEDHAMPGCGCYAGLQEIHIYPDGAVSGCCFLRGAGSVRDTSLRDILSSREFRDILRRSRVKDCPGCWSPPVHEYTMLVHPSGLAGGLKFAGKYLSWTKNKKHE